MTREFIGDVGGESERARGVRGWGECFARFFRRGAADHTRDYSGQTWVHRWAVAVAVVTFPLIWVGGLVTTYDAGMAVPDWPGTYGYNLFLYPWTAWIYGPFDLFAEHGHRLLGALVGVLAIGLMIASMLWEKRQWMQALCLVELIAVIAQGALGGFRVLLDERSMAMIHGCTGAAFFALATATAVMTSGWWQAASKIPISAPFSRFLVALLPVASFCQLVVGAQLRHIQPWAGPRQFVPLVHLHLTLAVIVTLLIIGIAVRVRVGQYRLMSRIGGPSGLLILLVMVQLCLGAGTWIASYAFPWTDLWPVFARYTIQAKGYWESWIVTGHQATGSLIIAVSTVLAFRLCRQYTPEQSRV